MREGRRDEFFVFVQDQYKLIGNWPLTAGLRFDRYSDFGATVNPGLALVWQSYQIKKL